MKQYTLLMNSMSGREGQTVMLDDESARQLAVHGIVKINGPTITKVVEPEVKKRGRPKNDPSNGAE